MTKQILTRLLSLIVFITLSSKLPAQDIRVVVNADMGEHTISKHIYGHFAEHLGRCVYGGFYVGEDNEQIPHKNGIRLDVVEALRDLKIPNLRWPGGCFADTYHWKDGIGPKEERPAIVNRWWGGVTEDNSFGTHDFLNMCEMLDTEPYLAANVGSGEVQELIDWVQYVNHDGQSPMADLRRKNGREEPWNVKFWGVGNEMWGCGGNMRPEYYADLYRRYATFMTGWSNEKGIYRIASGASSSDYNWTDVLMKNIPSNLIEGVALHHYSVIDWGDKGSAVEFTEDQYFTTMERALYMEELINRHLNIMDKYDPEEKTDLIVDEWGGWYDVQPGTNPGFLFQQNTMRDAMIAGTTLNIFNNHADRIYMANLAQTINVLQAVILTDEEKMILTPTYHVMKMYNVHQDALMLPVDIRNTDYTNGDRKLPAISVSASRDKNGALHISLVNIDAKTTYPVQLSVRGAAARKVTGQILTSERLQDHNSFEDPDKIAPSSFEDFSTSKNELNVKMPPYSVVVLEIRN